MHIVSIVLTVLVLAVAGFFVIKGDIAESLVQFKDWIKPWMKEKAKKIWPHIRAIRHIRRLANVPFHIYLYRRTRLMPFCLGQVWIGNGGSLRLIGKAENGDWIVDLGQGVTGIGSTGYVRGLVDELYMYLYEWDQSIDYIPTIGEMNGLKTIVLKRY